VKDDQNGMNKDIFTLNLLNYLKVTIHC